MWTINGKFQEVVAARGFGFKTSGHTWTINWGTISMWPWSREKGLERSGGSRDCNGFLATRTRRTLAARCRCTAAQLGELRQPDRCIFIWVQYIWYLIRNSCNVSFVNTGFRSFSSTNQIAFFAFSFHLQKNWQQWGRKLPLLSTSVVETVPLIALFWPAMLVKGPLLE